MHWYVGQVQGNVLAMPVQALITVAATLLFRKPVARWWHKHFGAKAEIDDIRRMVAALHRHHLGDRDNQDVEGA